MSLQWESCAVVTSNANDSATSVVEPDRAFADILEEFNEAMDCFSLDQAILLANEANSLDPENSVSEIMALKVRFALEDSVGSLIKLRDACTASRDEFDEVNPRNVVMSRVPIRGVNRKICGRARASLSQDGKGVALEFVLAKKLSSIDRHCRLSKAQSQKLLLAGRGDIKRFTERVRSVEFALQKRFRDEPFKDIETLPFRQLRELENSLQLGIFEDGSLFARTCNKCLTNAQKAVLSDKPDDSEDETP